MEEVVTLTQLTGCPCPALGTLALATHRVTGGLAMAEAALLAVCSVPPGRTGCEGKQGKLDIRKCRRRTQVQHHLFRLTVLL